MRTTTYWPVNHLLKTRSQEHISWKMKTSRQFCPIWTKKVSKPWNVNFLQHQCCTWKPALFYFNTLCIFSHNTGNMWKWQKKISVLSRRITGKWHLVRGIKESGPAERWPGTAGAISVFGYQWGTSTTVPQTIYSCGVSRRNILIFPRPDHLFHPLCALPALCWYKCLCSHAVNPSGELVQAKITLLLSLSLLAPLTSVSSPGMRGEESRTTLLAATQASSIHGIIVSDCLGKPDQGKCNAPDCSEGR